MENKIVTTVGAIGEADANYDIANFTLRLLVEDELASSALNRLQNQIVELDRTVKEIVELHQVKIKDAINSDVILLNKVRWNDILGTQVPDGFQGIYTIKFQTESVDKADKLYAELSVLHGVSVDKPFFDLKNSDRLTRKALKNAWKKVNEKFIDECDILGLNVDDFEIMSWNVLYPDSQKNKSLVGQRNSPYVNPVAVVQEIAVPGIPVNNTPKLAKILIDLNVSFKKKQ